MRIPSLLVLVILAAALGVAIAQPVPVTIYTDPPADAAHPAKMTVLHIASHGVIINGLIYQPPGAGPHPTVVICHGLPGNEKNLDLAQALRRAGWNAVTFNYRGSWGRRVASGLLRTLRMPTPCSHTCAILPTQRCSASIPTESLWPVTAWVAGWWRTPRRTITGSSEQ